MCSPFIHSSFLGSNVAADVLDAVEVELGDDLVVVEHLAVVVRAPAEQRQVVDERAGR